MLGDALACCMCVCLPGFRSSPVRTGRSVPYLWGFHSFVLHTSWLLFLERSIIDREVCAWCVVLVMPFVHTVKVFAANNNVCARSSYFAYDLLTHSPKHERTYLVTWYGRFVGRARLQRGQTVRVQVVVLRCRARPHRWRFHAGAQRGSLMD